ncbi:hypothetical protein ES288_A04G136800v1 [Gossypium darwinii]|uniref:Uncharacterized protein n=2 Tax=Gossypium TaxID=3633 RepID=A0A5D2QYG8_GOSTO|nr:hypothetical protein ES288_A04G136800v1 [Gossypium darwinii]TYI33489.1 hypothetical protein ES332_A04G136800v1 [Gossypium tomentosum]
MHIDTLVSMTQSMRAKVPFHSIASISNGDDYDIMKNKQSHYRRSMGDTRAIEVWILSMPSFIGHLQQDDDANMGMLLCLWTQLVY